MIKYVSGDKMEFINVDEHIILTDFYRECELEIDENWVEEMNPQKSIALYNDKALISAATVSKRFGKTVLDYIAVKAEFRKRGIGKIMLDKILENEDEVYLTARNYDFFCKNGFRAIEDNALIKECLGCPQYNKNCFPRVMKR